jgi:3'(2'), 5'-bisphosphate nucleotidase
VDRLIDEGFSFDADTALAGRLAHEAGELLLSVRSNLGRLAIDPRQLGRLADKRANDFILERLAQGRPDDAVLSEEKVDDRLRLSAARVWIVDPLDGTRGFTMDRPDWAVHIALWEAGIGITAAAVALPALGELFTTQNAPSVAAQGRAHVRERPLILVSPSRPPPFARFVARDVDADLATMGSAGGKAMMVLGGQADAYLVTGGQREWDSAAPVGVLKAAGFHSSRVDGSELVYNKPDSYVADFLMCRPELAEPLLDSIARAVAGGYRD